MVRSDQSRAKGLTSQMARHFLIDPPVHSIPTLEDYQAQWPHLKARQSHVAQDERFIELILGAHQYFEFHLMLLDRVKHQHVDQDKEPLGLNFTIRAGAVKSAIISGVSVIESVLLFHAQSRHIRISDKATFGSLVVAWKADKRHWADIKPINASLSRLLKVRNRVHLYSSPNTTWENVLTSEEEDLEKVHECIAFLQKLKTRDRRLPKRVNSFHRSTKSKNKSAS